jgi:hypothetical protein
MINVPRQSPHDKDRVLKTSPTSANTGAYLGVQGWTMGFAKASQFACEMSDGFIVEIQPCQSLVSDPSMGEGA